MTFIANHQWIIPLAFTVIWIGVCWYLITHMTGGLMFQVVGTILVAGIAFFWAVYGAWRWIAYLLGVWTLRD